MSSSQYIKYPSRQAGPFTVNQNLMDFEITDNNAVYDLSKSFINVMCKVDCSETTAQGHPGGIFNVKPIYGASNYAFNNIALVRNASMNCRKAGKVEDIREVGLFRNTLAAYRKGKSSKESNEYGSLYGFYDDNGYQQSPMRNINKYGTQLSTDVEAPIQIPLKDIFETGRLPEFHVSKWGQTRIHLETYLSKLSFEYNIFEIMNLYGTKKSNTTFDTGNIGVSVLPDSLAQYKNKEVNVYSAGVATFLKITDIAINGNQDGILITFGANLPGPNDDPLFVVDKYYVSVGTWAADNSPFTTTQKYDKKPDLLPNFVGEAVYVMNMTNPAGGNNLSTTITSSVMNADGTVSYGFAANVPNATAGDVLVIKRREAGTITTTFPSAEIVLKVVSNPSPAPERLQYMTITTEQFTSGTAITNFERMFQLEPSAMNFFVMFPDADYCYSQDDADVSLVRFRLDNKDLTDRDYEVFKVLYNDRLNMLMLNSGYAMKNVSGTIYSNYLLESDENNSDNVLVLGNPCPLTQNEKLLQVNIESTNGFQNMNIYKQVLRSI